jgi:hypothetical protein
MEITMKGLDRLSVCKTVVYLIVCAVFLVAATPLPATEPGAAFIVRDESSRLPACFPPQPQPATFPAGC